MKNNEKRDTQSLRIKNAYKIKEKILIHIINSLVCTIKKKSL